MSNKESGQWVNGYENELYNNWSGECMSSHIRKLIEAVVKEKFYEEFKINTVDNNYIVKGGIVRDIEVVRKPKRKKKKKTENIVRQNI